MPEIRFTLLSRIAEKRAGFGILRPGLQMLVCGFLLTAVLQLFAREAISSQAAVEHPASCCAITGFPTDRHDLRELQPGETIHRQVEINQVDSFFVRLAAGESITLTIPQHGMAVVVKTYAPDGRQLGDHQQQTDEMMIQPIILAAEQPGDYRLRVFTSFPGTYTLAAGSRRSTTEADQKHLAAQKLYIEYLLAPGVRSEEKDRRRLEKLQQRLAIYRSLNDPQLIGRSLMDLAAFAHFLGQYSMMLDFYQKALQTLRAIDNVAEVCSVLGAIAGDAAYRRGDYQTAIDHLTEALALSRSRLYKNGESSALHQLGVLYHVLADEPRALDFYERSLAVQQSIDPPTIVSILAQAATLSNTGNLARGLGESEETPNPSIKRTVADRQKAIEYYQRALAIYRNVKTINGHRAGQTGEAAMLLSIGNTYKELGDFASSIVFLEQSLELYKNLRYRPGELSALRSIGNLYALKGDYRKSFDYHGQLLKLLKTGADNNNQARILAAAAVDYHRGGQTLTALALLDEALLVSRAREQQAVAATALFESARIERDLGNFANARRKIEDVIQIVESIRAKIAVQEIRAAYFATVRKYYDFYVDLLMQAHKSQPEKGFDALALQMSEQARSRSLLDLLSLAQIDIRQGVDLALLAQERQVRERLLEKAYQQNRLLLGPHTAEEADEIEREVAALTSEYQATETEIRRKSPRYAAITQPTSLRAAQIQQLLDAGTILLEYSLGETKSYLWVVTSNSIHSFDLPRREEIEAQARRVYELLTVRNQRLPDDTDERRRARIRAAEAEYPKAAATLSRLLLGPAAAQIRTQRLLVVPDGALNYIPFAALPVPSNLEAAAAWQPLGISHEIVTLPSAAVLALLRGETKDRKQAPKIVAVYADPVFSRQDERFGSRPAVTRGRGLPPQPRVSEMSTASTRDMERSLTTIGLDSNEGGLPRLPFSRREANSIFKAAPASLSLREVDFGASKAHVLSANLDQYRILHFATHSLLNTQHPELSGIVLSLIDEKGGEQDGFLRLQDIYNLRLGADLVVLSACNTALGKDVKGEGLIGLTRGFMYAGAPRVVASLWKVDDAATAALMTIFYRKMLRENLRPAAALRAAQAEMRAQNRWKSPYYWAPFVIQGEWK